MAYESYAKATPVDSGSNLNPLKAYKLEWTVLRNADDYVYWDKGAAFYTSSFTHSFHFNLTSVSAASALAHLWMLTNNLDDGAWLRSNADHMRMWVFNNAGTHQITVGDVYNSGSNTTNSASKIDVSLATDYWCDVVLDTGGGTLTVSIYDDIDKTSHVSNSPISITYNVSLSFRYLFAINSHNSLAGENYVGISTHLNTDPTEANIVGVSAYAVPLPYTPQNSIWFDGINHTCMIHEGAAIASAEQPKMVHASSDDDVFGIPHDCPSVGATGGAQYFSNYYGYKATYGSLPSIFLNDGAVKDSVICYKDDDSMSNTKTMGAGWEDSALGDMDIYPSIVVDKNNFVWRAGRDGSGGSAAIKVVRAAQTFNENAWDSPTTMKATATSSSMPQLVVYENGDVGCLYTSSTTLYYRHWDASTATDSNDWDAEQTVATTDVYDYRQFCGVVMRVGGSTEEKLFVVRRTATRTIMYYRIRTVSTDLWGTDTSFVTDAVDANHQFQCCADVGNDETAYVIYMDSSGNMVHRNWNGTVVSDKTTQVSSPSLESNFFSAPMYDSEKIPILYHTDDHNIRKTEISLTRTQESSDGIIISTRGAATQGTMGSTNHAVSKGDKTLCMWVERDHRVYIRLINTATNTWLTAATVFLERRWDLHNRPTMNISPDDDKVRIVVDGRSGGNTSHYLQVFESDYALDHASFGVVKADDWTDISPTTMLGEYKNVAVDSAATIYLLLDDHTTSTEKTWIMELPSGGSWGTPVEIYNSSAANDLNYSTMALGREGSNQNLLCCLTVRDFDVQPETPFGSVVNNDFSFYKIDPQGSDVFKLYRMDGVEMSIPMTPKNRDMIYSGEDAGDLMGITVRLDSTAYSENAMIFLNPADNHIYRCSVAGTTAGTEPAYSQDHNTDTVDGTATFQEYSVKGDDWVRLRGWPDSIDTSTPIAVYLKTLSTGDFGITKLMFTKWDGTNPTAIEVKSGNFPQHYLPKVIKAGAALFIIAVETVSGVDEIIYIVSTDGGATWNDGDNSPITSSIYNNNNPSISDRTSTIKNAVFHRRIHRNYSEVMLDALSVGGPLFKRPHDAYIRNLITR